MRRFLATLALAVLVALSSLSLSLGVCPVKDDFPPHPCPQPYVSISVTPQSFDLGNVPQPGLYDSPAAMMLRIEANCPHGGVFANATPLVLSNGGSIGPDRIFVRIPATGGYLPLDSLVNVTGPLGPGAFDIVLNFRVITEINNQAGTYSGTIVFTCGGCP